MSNPLFASCLGLICPVGLAPESAAAALRARISAFHELPYAEAAGDPVVGACVPGLASDLSGRERLSALLTRACLVAAMRLPPGLTLADLPLILCTREPQRPGARLSGLVNEVEARLGLAWRREHGHHAAGGPVGVFEALARGPRLLAERRVEAFLIACVDSLVDARSLLWLDTARRLKTPQCPDGVIPGEAACVILVSARPLTPTCVMVAGWGFATETATVMNDEPLQGQGMAAAIRTALQQAGLAMHEVDFRLSDVAGESYAFEELALAQARVMRKTRPTQDLWLPAGCIGDTGAAAGGIQLAWAEQAFARAYAPGPVALLQAGAFAGVRAAAVLKTPGAPHVA